MSETLTLPDRATAKALAKRLRQSLVAEGNFVSHGEALELTAKQFGYRDWNTLSARLDHTVPRPLSVGGRVTGHYLGHAFTGTLLGLQVMKGERRQVVIEFDQPIDVVASEHFSSHRRRVSGVLERNGASWDKTSDGQPVLELDL
ncbi:glyoxalase superfamily protein [Maricaulis sp.]|uniref:glyoxalase superfamily protein n=1 Tax=Maricaulis sp. TaxID=1486257 RepID=UPI002635DEB7|nr:glyoxalase superfamily protein [Maricaulis sp.]